MIGLEPTWSTVIESTWACFLESGYTVTSIDAVAARAGLDKEVLSRLFGSRRELYLAAFDAAEAFVFERLCSAAGTKSTFAAKVEAALNEFLRLRDDDVSALRFLSIAAADLTQQSDLREAREVHWPRRLEFVGELVEAGVLSGELAASDRPMVADMMSTFLAGLLLMEGLAPPGVHSSVVQGFNRLIAGSLVTSGREVRCDASLLTY